MSSNPIEVKPRLSISRKWMRREEDAAEESECVLSDDGYLVLPCGGCGKLVKVAPTSLNRRMGCPYCKEPLDLDGIWSEEEGDEEVLSEFTARKDEPLISKPVVARELREEDIAEAFDLEFADEYARRRLPTEAPEWDEEVIEGKGSRILKAGSLRKLQTRKEYMLSSMTRVIMLVSTVIVAVIVYLAVVRVVGVAKRDRKTLEETPVTVRQAIDEVKNQETPITIFLTSAEEAGALAVVNGFLNAKTVEERLAFVRHPERVRPLMEEWNGRGEAMFGWPDGTVLLRDKQVDQGRLFVRLAIEFVGIGQRIFSVEQTREGFKLDWETATGYQEMSLERFKAERPVTPVTFRVKMKWSDYYNYEFRDRERYQAVELSYPGRRELKLVGYIDRRREWASRLIGQLEAGIGPSMLVQLQYLSGSPQEDTQVEVFAIVAETWWL